MSHIPWMTISTFLFTAAFLLSAIVDQLPPKVGAYCAAAIAVAGALGKAIYALAVNNGRPPTMPGGEDA